MQYRVAVGTEVRHVLADVVLPISIKVMDEDSVVATTHVADLGLIFQKRPIMSQKKDLLTFPIRIASLDFPPALVDMAALPRACDIGAMERRPTHRTHLVIISAPIRVLRTLLVHMRHPAKIARLLPCAKTRQRAEFRTPLLYPRWWSLERSTALLAEDCNTAPALEICASHRR